MYIYMHSSLCLCPADTRTFVMAAAPDDRTFSRRGKCSAIKNMHGLAQIII